MTLAARVASRIDSRTLPEAWRISVPTASAAALAPERHGKLEAWSTLLAALPEAVARHSDLARARARIGAPEQLEETDRAALRSTLLALHPWRKGPFEVFGVEIDAEWRSDLKFERLAAVPLTGARVLDVGCGNGYYAMRMIGAGAREVIGVEPGLGHVAQFTALAHFLPDLPIALLPVPFEVLPTTPAFDVVCSMGVIYHRRSPIDHLDGLTRMLAPGGTLVLESIVVPGGADTLLCPQDRYARMRNVWFLPSTALMVRWLQRLGFREIDVLHEGPTTPEEQRATEWMHFDSLVDALDTADASRTVEGHPAPRRAVIAARR